MRRTDFTIQTDHLISARQPELELINKKSTYQIVEFDIPTEQSIKFKESEKKRKSLDLSKNGGTWKWG